MYKKHFSPETKKCEFFFRRTIQKCVIPALFDLIILINLTQNIAHHVNLNFLNFQ